MCSIWLGGLRAFLLLSLSLTFFRCLSPLPLLCLSVVPADFRGAEGCGATSYSVVRLALCFALPAFGFFFNGGKYHPACQCRTITYLTVIPCVFPL